MKKTLLQRQLEKLGLSEAHPPKDESSWQQFLEKVEKSYSESEAQRVFNEDLLAATTKEMTNLFEKLKVTSEASLQSEADKLSAVIEGIPSLIAWVDRKSQILGANGSLAALVGRSKSEIVNLRFSELDLSSMDQFLNAFFRKPQLEDFLELAVLKSDRLKFFKVIARKFNQNSMVAIIGIEITTEIQKEKELELARTKSLAAARMAVLGEMAGGIAHEINNPLAIIHGAAEQLKRKGKDMTPEQIVERAEHIKKTVLRTTKIISGLRAFARNEDQDPFSCVAVSTLINDTLELSQSQISKLGIDLQVPQVPADLMIDCRPGQICQVLLNLLNNAKDAIKDRPDPWIRIEVECSDSRIRFEVTDCGPGITSEIREKIFQPFFTTKEVGVGTGLGLSISLGIVKDHSGNFLVDEKCANTCFVVDLPQHQLQNLKVA